MKEPIRVLVAILNDRLDFELVQNQNWYRIPVSSQKKWLKKRWPPQWLSFYQTKIFGSEAFAINYYAQVLNIRRVSRWQLFPDEPPNKKSKRQYYQMMLGSLQKLPQPILSRRWRRIAFIQTTWHKFINATEINDLYDESPLEDKLWAEFKRLKISADRQEFIMVNKRNYALDFAIYCAKGNLNVETDGDMWHADPQRIPLDNLRDNDLETAGWHLLRFNTKQILEEMTEYCIPTIIQNVNKLGGLETGEAIARKITPPSAEGGIQPSLFSTIDQQ